MLAVLVVVGVLIAGCPSVCGGGPAGQVDDGVVGVGRGCAVTEVLGGGAGGRPGRDAFLAPVRTGAAGCGGGHGGLVQGADVAVVSDHGAGAGGGEAVAGQDDLGAVGGGDLEDRLVESVAGQDLGAGEFGRHRVLVAAVGHQCLGRDGALDGDSGRERRRQRGQGLAGGDGDHAGPPVGGGADAGVAAQRAEPVEPGLSVLDRHLVGQGAPPALSGGVVGLLHHTLAVPGPRWADRHRHAVVLRDAGEARGDLAGGGVADRGHPVEAPAVGQPAEPDRDAVQRVDQMRLIHGFGQHPTPPPGVRQCPDQQERGLAPPPARGRVRELDPVELGLLTRWVFDDRHRPGRDRAARLARRAQPAGPQLAGQRRIGPVEPEVDELVVQGLRPQVRVLGQPFTAVGHERLERIIGGLGALPGDPLPGQVAAHGAGRDGCRARRTGPRTCA
jgi:hypothetical protein